MRLTLVNQFYRPDISPTAQLAASLAEHRAALGDQVTVVCGAGQYVSVGGGGNPDQRVRVVRVWTPGFGKKTLPGRLLDYLCFWLLAATHLLALPRQDVVISMTTPPFVALLAVLHQLRHRRSKLVLWVMDCYPEVAEMAGLLRPTGLPSRIMRAVNRFLFRRLSWLVCLDGAMRDMLLRLYAAGPIRPPATVIPNWERLAQFPADAAPPLWPGAAELKDRFVILYQGNAGQGHAFDTALAAARLLRDEPVTFLFVGGGSRWAELKKAQDGLPNLVLHGYIPKDQTPGLMAACHLALITLRDEAVGLISPSKLHAGLAAGLPVVYLGPAGSNVDEAITRFGVGLTARHGDADRVAEFIRHQLRNPTEYARLRVASRAAFEAAYCDVVTLPQFDRLLSGLTAERPGDRR